MKKVLVVTSFLLSIFLLSATSALAHVAVRPREVGVGAFQTFTVGVPVEKDIPTTGVRLVIPEGLNHVTPNVKSGWRIEIKREPAGEGDDHGRPVTEIIWSGGVIPAGQRDDFLFSAQVPAESTVLSWKAYQTYQDGSVVSWELSPNQEQPKDTDGKADYSRFGPASQTSVVDDLSQTTPSPAQQEVGSNRSSTNTLATIALLVSVASIALHFIKR